MEAFVQIYFGSTIVQVKEVKICCPFLSMTVGKHFVRMSPTNPAKNRRQVRQIVNKALSCSLLEEIITQRIKLL